MKRGVLLKLIAPKLSARRRDGDIGPASLTAKRPTIVLRLMVHSCHQIQTEFNSFSRAKLLQTITRHTNHQTDDAVFPCLTHTHAHTRSLAHKFQC